MRPRDMDRPVSLVVLSEKEGWCRKQCASPTSLHAVVSMSHPWTPWLLTVVPCPVIVRLHLVCRTDLVGRADVCCGSSVTTPSGTVATAHVGEKAFLLAADAPRDRWDRLKLRLDAARDRRPNGTSWLPDTCADTADPLESRNASLQRGSATGRVHELLSSDSGDMAR